MTERDLDKLKNLPVPAPRETARKAALDAAMAAFDENAPASLSPLGEAAAERRVRGQATETAVGTPLTSDSPLTPTLSPRGEGEVSSQGNIIPLRQTETSDRKRSFRMQLSSRRTQALAASVAALIVAAPFAFHQFNRELENSFTKVQTELKNAAGGSSSPQPVAAETRRERDGAKQSESKIALAEARKAEAPASLMAEPGPAGARPESGAVPAEKRVVPPDLVGKTRLGRHGAGYRSRYGASQAEMGLAAVGRSTRNIPWNCRRRRQTDCSCQHRRGVAAICTGRDAARVRGDRGGASSGAAWPKQCLYSR